MNNKDDASIQNRKSKGLVKLGLWLSTRHGRDRVISINCSFKPFDEAFTTAICLIALALAFTYFLANDIGNDERLHGTLSE